MTIFVVTRTQLPAGPTVVQCAFSTRAAASAEIAARMNSMSWESWAWQIQVCSLLQESPK